MSPLHRTAPQTPWLRRMGWFVLIWTASVLGLGLVAFALRAAMAAAGMKA